MKPLPGLLADEGGAVIVIVTVVLAVLIGFAGIVIDLGHLFVVRSTLQNAADSASLAAAASLRYGPDEARNQAQLLAQYHAVDGTLITLVLADIELGTWDEGSKTFTVLAPDQEANADSVRVTSQRSSARNNPISLFFIRIFGHETSDVRAMAVAHYEPALCGGIIGETKITFNSSTGTDSYNSDYGPYSPVSANENGDVCSCGDIELNSTAIVRGNANPGPDNTVIMNNSSYVTGSTRPGGCPVLADVELGDIATYNDNGNIPAVTTDRGKDPFEMGPYDLALHSSDSLTLPGGTSENPARYYFTSVDIAHSSTLTVMGPTVMYVTGKFEMHSSTIVNTGQNPEDLIIMVSSIEDVQFNHDVDFYGIIYAPNAHVVLNSGVGFYGAIMAQEITLNSAVVVHYDESLGDIALLSDVEILPGNTVSSVLVQ